VTVLTGRDETARSPDSYLGLVMRPNAERDHDGTAMALTGRGFRARGPLAGRDAFAGRGPFAGLVALRGLGASATSRRTDYPPRCDMGVALREGEAGRLG